MLLFYLYIYLQNKPFNTYSKIIFASNKEMITISNNVFYFFNIVIFKIFIFY